MIDHLMFRDLDNVVLNKAEAALGEKSVANLAAEIRTSLGFKRWIESTQGLDKNDLHPI